MNDKSMASGTSAVERCAARADHRRVPRIDPVSATAYIAAMALRDILFETMYDAPGIGLAAIQIGTPKRVITMDLAKKEDPRNPQVFINPEIVWSSQEKAIYEEGCLSIPEYFDDVERPVQVRVKYLDLEGKPQEVEANGLLATCLQHEIDHVNGILFIDHLSKLKRERVLKKFTKAAKRAAAV